MGPQSPLPASNDIVDYSAPTPPRQFAEEELALAAVGDSSGWKMVVEHLNERKDFYRTNLPGGEALANLKGEELEVAVKVASYVMAEIELLVGTIEGLNSATKLSKQ